jgi:hypothetical protein
MLFSTMTRVYTVAPVHGGPSWWESVAFFLSDPLNMGLSALAAECAVIVLDLVLEWLLRVFRRPVKGYKGFYDDLTAYDGFQYKVGDEYVMFEEPAICQKGFHFCRRLSEAMRYFPPPKKRYCEVLALGKLDREGDKFCTDRIRIVRELSVPEIREILEKEQPRSHWLLYFPRVPTRWMDGRLQTETWRQRRKRTMKHRKGYRRC